ncbi:MAG: hypothetical protein HY822_22520, partial [Acidobacteria bacterium]|nr:hypothetical protein [Acidobacteriota bacterium]
MPQNPSPMTDSTRAHRRLSQSELPGGRAKLSLGTLLAPLKARPGRKIPLLVHFHGAEWVAEQSGRQWNSRTAVLAVQIGSGSGVYASAFETPGRFRALLDEAGARFGPVVVTCFSAGYGAVREILKDRANWDRIDALVLADSLHSDLDIDAGQMRPFVDFARQAAAKRKRMLVTHSEVFPGTFASTTQTADYFLGQLGLKRRAVLKWGPLGMQQLSQARAGRFEMLGFAGNSAPDHIDHLHALAWWLKR